MKKFLDIFGIISLFILIAAFLYFIGYFIIDDYRFAIVYFVSIIVMFGSYRGFNIIYPWLTARKEKKR